MARLNALSCNVLLLTQSLITPLKSNECSGYVKHCVTVS